MAFFVFVILVVMFAVWWTSLQIRKHKQGQEEELYYQNKHLFDSIPNLDIEYKKLIKDYLEGK